MCVAMPYFLLHEFLTIGVIWSASSARVRRVFVCGRARGCECCAYLSAGIKRWDDGSQYKGKFMYGNRHGKGAS